MKMRSVVHFRAIESDAEACEAAGFVLDCIIAGGGKDDGLGDSARLHPVEISRSSDGSIQYVMCEARASALKTEERILIGMPA